MPSPIAHSVIGYLLSQVPAIKRTLPKKAGKLMPIAAIYGVVVSNSPDLDFVPQLLTGIRFHRGPSHSLFAALLISGLLAGIVYVIRDRTRYWSLFAMTLLLYSTHLGMDVFTAGGTGIPLLWPLSDRTFHAPFMLFPPVHHSRGLFDSSHLIFIGVELLYSIVFCTTISLIRGRSQRQKSQHRDISPP